MKPTPRRTFINLLARSHRAFSSAAHLRLMLLCSLALASNALAQEPTQEETLPSAPTRADRQPTQKKDAVPPANGKLQLNATSAPAANQVVDGDIIFTSPGAFTYPRDIHLSDNYGGLRLIGAPSLTTTPAGAAIQFFGNNATPYNGQLYLDSGAFDSAALIFRTAVTGGTITERMRVTASGNVGIGTTETGGARLLVVTDASGPSSAVAGITTNSGGFAVYGFSSDGYGVFGNSSSGNGVHGFSNSGPGISGQSSSGPGVSGYSDSSYAGEFLGRVRVTSIPFLPSTKAVCFDSSNVLVQCGASSLRLKTDVQSFSGGLDLVRRLRPISFRWKENGSADIGLGAEEVEKVAPSFVFSSPEGVVEGVKYERLNMVLINAVKEQQTQIEQQKAVIEGLRKIVCRRNRRADVCR